MNALTSIQLGVEDYQAAKKDPRRSLSGVRNIYAGWRFEGLYDKLFPSTIERKYSSMADFLIDVNTIYFHAFTAMKKLNASGAAIVVTFCPVEEGIESFKICIIKSNAVIRDYDAIDLTNSLEQR
jgi:hypothetical protein